LNREQKREMIRRLRKQGLTKASAETCIIRMENKTENLPFSFEGEKVKIDFARIVSYPDWNELKENYRNWITEHKDEVFTVQFDPKRKEKNTNDVNTIVQLEEDTTEPKWLFWAGDLIPEKDQPNKDKKDEIVDNAHAELDAKIAEIQANLE